MNVVGKATVGSPKGMGSSGEEERSRRGSGGGESLFDYYVELPEDSEEVEGERTYEWEAFGDRRDEAMSYAEEMALSREPDDSVMVMVVARASGNEPWSWRAHR